MSLRSTELLLFTCLRIFTWANVPHTKTSVLTSAQMLALLFLGLKTSECHSPETFTLYHHTGTNAAALPWLEVVIDGDTKHWDFCLVL